MKDATLQRKLQHLTRALGATKVLVVTDHSDRCNEEKEQQLSLWDEPEEVQESAALAPLFKLADAKDHLVLLKPIRWAVTTSEFGSSDVIVCDCIVADIDPPELHQATFLFWKAIQKQLEPKIGMDRWVAGRVKQGTTNNKKEWWLDHARQSDAPTLEKALESAVVIPRPEKKSSGEAEEAF